MISYSHYVRAVGLPWLCRAWPGLLNSVRFYWLDRSLNSWTEVNKAATPWDMLFSWLCARTQGGERTKANYASPLKFYSDVTSVTSTQIPWAKGSHTIKFSVTVLGNTTCLQEVLPGWNKKLWTNNTVHHNLSPMFVKASIWLFVILITL